LKPTLPGSPAALKSPFAKFPFAAKCNVVPEGGGVTTGGGGGS